MGAVQESGIIGILEAIDKALSVFGLSNPLYDAVMQADYDQAPSERQLQAAQQGSSIAEASLQQYRGSEVSQADWVGEARKGMDKDKECNLTFEETLLDCYLALIEIVLQVLDYLIDLLRIIIAIVVAVCTAIVAIAAAAVALSVITAGGSLAAGFAAAGAAIGAGVLGTIGTIAALGAVASAVLWLLNMLVEALHEATYNARQDGCLSGKPALPDWDPEIPALPS
ncbi:hypothetical protein ACQBAU_14155 [Propionibacteriaceae bacterium Y2011]